MKYVQDMKIFISSFFRLYFYFVEKLFSLFDSGTAHTTYSITTAICKLMSIVSNEAGAGAGTRLRVSRKCLRDLIVA